MTLLRLVLQNLRQRWRERQERRAITKGEMTFSLEERLRMLWARRQ